MSLQEPESGRPHQCVEPCSLEDLQQTSNTTKKKRTKPRFVLSDYTLQGKAPISSPQLDTDGPETQTSATSPRDPIAVEQKCLPLTWGLLQVREQQERLGALPNLVPVHLDDHFLSSFSPSLPAEFGYHREPWPPRDKDLTINQLAPVFDEQPFVTDKDTVLYHFSAEKTYIYKHGAPERELRMMKAAGGCAITPIGRVLSIARTDPTEEHTYVHDAVRFEGITMAEGYPIDLAAVPLEAQGSVREGLIACVARLHSEYNMVHGNIRPESFLINSSGDIRLWDFAQAKLLDVKKHTWKRDPDTCLLYMSPRRAARCELRPEGGFRQGPPPPTVEDDVYALGLCIWELYTRRKAWDGSWTNDELFENLAFHKDTVDVDQIDDDEVREMVRLFLRAGDARA